MANEALTPILSLSAWRSLLRSVGVDWSLRSPSHCFSFALRLRGFLLAGDPLAHSRSAISFRRNLPFSANGLPLHESQRLISARASSNDSPCCFSQSISFCKSAFCRGVLALGRCSSKITWCTSLVFWFVRYTLWSAPASSSIRATSYCPPQPTAFIAGVLPDVFL